MKKYSVYVVLDCMAEDEEDAKSWIKESMEYAASDYNVTDVEIECYAHIEKE